MAIRITRVYTRTGDQGETALVGGRRVAKDSQRIVAYGAIDELNSVLGIVRALATKESSKAAARLIELLKRLQNELFDLGSELATPPDVEYEGMWRASEGEVLELERTIDECQKSLEPLKSFILPGGGAAGAFLHQARTVCRRAEVEIFSLVAHGSREPVRSPIPESPLRSAVRPGALDRQERRRTGVPVGTGLASADQAREGKMTGFSLRATEKAPTMPF